MRVRRCQVCPDGPPLGESQPDQADYVRLLATCPSCGRWYSVLDVPNRHLIVRLLPVPTLVELGVSLESTPAV